MVVDVRYRAGSAAGSAERRGAPIEVTLDVVHSDDAALVADLERRLGGRVLRHQVKDVDYVRDTMVVDVRYRVWKPVARPAHAPVNQGALNQAVPNQPGPAAAAASRSSSGAASTGTRGREPMTVVDLDTRRTAPPHPRPSGRGPAATPAEGAVAAAAATVEPIGLDELMALAELQTRVDRKYFVPADVFHRSIGELAGELQVLEIDGRRSFGYESVYFDTPRLDTYRAHLQRRRRRFKARTRTYTDSG